MLGDLPLMAQLKERMRWHQARQGVLAANVANADTPGYRPRDLKPFDPRTTSPMSGAGGGSLALAPAGGVTLAGSGAGFAPGARRVGDFETTPSRNGVNLEDEMMRVAQNQMDYQQAATLYQKGLGRLKIALGRRS